MSLRTNLVLLGVAAILGVGVWWFEFRVVEARAVQDAAARKVLGIEASNVRRVEVPLADGRRARMTRVPGPSEQWRLEAPVEFPADPTAAIALVTALASLSTEAVLENAPADLAPFGLAEDRAEILVWSEAAEPQQLWLGGDAPFGGGRYAQVSGDESRIVTLDRAGTSGLSPELDTLRDARIVDFDPAAVARFSIASPAGLIVELERVDAPPPAGPEWRIVAPIEAPADARQVRRTLGDLARVRADGFVDFPEEGRDYGLDSAERTLEFGLGEGSVRLDLGRDEGAAYLRASDGATLLKLDDRIFAQLPTDRFAYRDKQVLKLDDDRVRRVELEFPRDERVFRFSRDERRWIPEDAGDPGVDSLRVDDLVYALRDLEATGLESDTGGASLAALGLDPPAARVRLLDEERRELGWLELATPQPSLGMAARSSQSERIWRVRNDLAEDVPLSLEAFENRFVADPAVPAGTEAGSP